MPKDQEDQEEPKERNELLASCMEVCIFANMGSCFAELLMVCIRFSSAFLLLLDRIRALSAGASGGA